MIIALNFNAPELAEELVNQLPEAWIVQIGEGKTVQNQLYRIKENKYWVGNWVDVFNVLWRTFCKPGKEQNMPQYPYIWMVNDDITGATMRMYHDLIEIAEDHDAFMVTPAFNSPHSIFHPVVGNDIREVNWVDMCCPLINFEKYLALEGFDPAFKGYGADIDLSVRAREKGLKMIVSDQHEIYHIGGYTVKKNNTWEQSNVDEMNKVLMAKYGKVWHELV